MKHCPAARYAAGMVRFPLLRRQIPTALLAALLAVALAGIAAPASADDAAVPYWAALRADEVNMRVGPGEDYRISWVYHRKGLPVKVLRVMSGWRLVEDPGGARGWMVARFLTRRLGAIVEGAGPAEMRDGPAQDARLKWRLAPGVVGELGECDTGWCHLDVGGRRGYVLQARIWGAGRP